MFKALSYWTLDEALELIRGLQPEARKYGYHLCLGGGVLNKGESKKDLDLYFLPLNGNKQNEAQGLVYWLEGLWGSYGIIGADYPPDPVCAHRVTFNYSGLRIDVFVIGGGNAEEGRQVGEGRYIQSGEQQTAGVGETWNLPEPPATAEEAAISWARNLTPRGTPAPVYTFAEQDQAVNDRANLRFGPADLDALEQPDAPRVAMTDLCENCGQERGRHSTVLGRTRCRTPEGWSETMTFAMAPRPRATRSFWASTGQQWFTMGANSPARGAVITDIATEGATNG